MKRLQKAGGIAALYEAAAYIIGIVFFLGVVDYAGITQPEAKVTAISENMAAMYLITLLIYVVFAVFLVILTLAIYERLKEETPDLMKVAAILGFIWAGVLIASGMIFNIGMEKVAALAKTDLAQAATVWIAVEVVTDGLGGGNEIVGGIWILFICIAAMKPNGFPKVLNYIGLIVGMAGVLSAVPPLGEIGGMVFGLGQIVWFIWVGVALLRPQPAA